MTRWKKKLLHLKQYLNEIIPEYEMMKEKFICFDTSLPFKELEKATKENCFWFTSPKLIHEKLRIASEKQVYEVKLFTFNLKPLLMSLVNKLRRVEKNQKANFRRRKVLWKEENKCFVRGAQFCFLFIISCKFSS